MSIAKNQGSIDIKFGEELKRRLSELTDDEESPPTEISGEPNGKLTDSQPDAYKPPTETRPRKATSIFRPLKKFSPPVVQLPTETGKKSQKQNPYYLFVAICVCLILGLAIGGMMTLRADPFTEREVFYIELPGNLISRSIEILLIPYIISAVMSSVGKVPTLIYLKMSSKILVYSILTTLCAAFLGIVISFALPVYSDKLQHNPQEKLDVVFAIAEVIIDILLNLLPNNIVYACLATEHVKLSVNKNVSGVLKGSFEIETLDKTNFIGLVSFSILLGMAIRLLGEGANWIFCLMDILSDLTTLITTWLLWASSLGLFFHIIGQIASQRDWIEIANKLLVLTGLYFLGIIIHCLMILPLAFYVITFSNPFTYALNISHGLLVGFATAKSYSALPFVLKCLEKHKRVNLQLATSTLPLIATINKNGNVLLSALLSSYIIHRTQSGMTVVKAVQILFFSVLSNMDINLKNGIFQNVLFLASHVGIHANEAQNEVSIFYNVSWILDRLRVCCNLLSNVIGIRIIQRVSFKDLMVLKDVKPNDCGELKSQILKVKVKQSSENIVY